MKKLLAFLLFSIPALAQSPVIGGAVQYVFTAPSGSCGAAPPIEVLYSTGAIYTCDNGTWAVQGGGGSGTFNALTGDATSTATGGATTVVGLNGTLLSALATGLLKNTTGTGAPSIATAGTDYVIPSGSITGTATNITATSNSTLVTLSALSLPYSQITGAPSSGFPITIGSTSVASGSTTTTIAGLTLTSPTLTTPALGTPASGVITNLTGTCTSCVSNSATLDLPLAGGTVTGLTTFSNSPGTGAGAYGLSITGVPITSSLFNPVVYINGGGTTPSWANESPMLSINTPNGYSTSAHVFEINANGNAVVYATTGGALIATGTVGAGTGGQLQIGLRGNFSSAATGTINVGTGQTSGSGGSMAMSGLTLVAAAPTVSASQVGFGGTVTANTNCGTLGTGCLVINVAGTTRYLTYY